MRKNGDAFVYYQKLEECYTRLAEVLAAGESAEPREIEQLAAESDRIMTILAGMPRPEGEPGEIMARLTSLQKKADRLIIQMQEEREKVAKARSMLKKGRQALYAYSSPPQKTGYREGKFVDRKK